MENCGNRSHDPGEDLRSCGEAKTKSSELVHLALRHKPKEVARPRMDRDQQVRFLEVHGGHPASLTDRQEDRLDGLHPEMRHVHVEIEGREIDDRSPGPRGLPYNKQTAVEAEGG